MKQVQKPTEISEYFALTSEACLKIRGDMFKLRFQDDTDALVIEEDVRSWNEKLSMIVPHGRGFFVDADEVGYSSPYDDYPIVYVLFADETFYEGLQAHLQQGEEIISALPAAEAA